MVKRRKFKQCALHAYHWPPVLDGDIHHIIPLSMGGPDTNDNIMHVCPTGHRNVHEVITALVKKQPLPKATKKERQTAYYILDSQISRPK